MSSERRHVRRWSVTLVAIFLMGPVQAQDPNACDLPGEHPDAVISDLFEKRRLGSVGEITAFSLGTQSCNVGTCWMAVSSSNDQHPVFAMNLHRLKGGRFEQIGQSWAAHRFVALSQPNCSSGCVFAPSNFLGVDCSTNDLAVYGAGQAQLGPRFEVNPVTGEFPFPPTDSTLFGDEIYKRLQVHNTDLDPALNVGALYFTEGIYVTPDDAAGGNQVNNASYRPADVFEAAGELDFDLTGSTQQGSPGLAAWREHDPAVLLGFTDVSHDGRFVIGSKATPLGDGRWHYEYAVLNLSSHRSALGLRAPLPSGATVTYAGFHDVDYHSGEPFDGTDWPPSVGATSEISWSTETFGSNENANALRWGTLYNFRFQTDVAPVQATVELDLFRPGTPTSVSLDAMVPGACDGDGECEANETTCSCPADCGAAPAFELACGDGLSNDCDGLIDCADPDCCADGACTGVDADVDGFASCADCDETNPLAWAAPSGATDLRFINGGNTLVWSAPSAPGAASVTYRTLRSHDPRGFLAAATCLPDDGTDTVATDGEIPSQGAGFFYVVVPENACPFGLGSPGSDSDGQPRPALICP